MKIKKIQLKDVKPGMRIKSFDGTRHVFQKVVDIWQTEVELQDRLILNFTNGTSLKCSARHPIMVLEDSTLTEVLPRDLTQNHEIVTENGTCYLDYLETDTSPVRYLDLEVENTNSFFAAGEKTQQLILTHNCNQGSIRSGAATAYFPFWHLEFEDLVVLKNNKGTDDNRARHLDYGVQFNRLAYERLLAGGNITLFSPSDVPGLYDAFFVDQEQFKTLYEKYEADDSIRKKTLRAVDVFSTFMSERKNTGRVYMMNVDHANTHGSYIESLAPIRQSNLCVTGDTVIQIQHTDGSQESICLSNFVQAWNCGSMTGVKVRSYNTQTASFVWENVSAAAKTATVTRLMEIQEGTGNTIRCTPDHQIWTQNRGWVMAKDLSDTDRLCCLTSLPPNPSCLHPQPMINIRPIQLEPTDVYDITVPQTASFVANNIVVHNCSEILEPTWPLQNIDGGARPVVLKVARSSLELFRVWRSQWKNIIAVLSEDALQHCCVLSPNETRDPENFVYIDDKIADLNSGGVALCTLAAINWGKIREPKDFEKPCRLAVRALDALLDYQDYPVAAAEAHAMIFRNLGIGIVNLAYWIAKMGFKYSDDSALATLDEYAEAWSYYMIRASVDLAMEKGAPEGSQLTKYAQGTVPIDTRKLETDELVGYNERLPWHKLREDLRQHGIRNTTLLACMPSEASSLISNSTNGIEPPRSLISIKQSKDGVMKQVVPEYRRLKNRYELLWDQKSPEGYLKIVAVLQRWMDQTISANTSYNPAFYPEGQLPMSEMLRHMLLMYKWGIKTAYYFNVLDGQDEIDTDKLILEQESESLQDQENCEACTI